MENDSCGLVLLQIVSRGNATIAEIFRLKKLIPSVFRLKEKQELQKYGKIILNFSYFENSREIENQIEANSVLNDLNKELKENYLEIINQFYFLFENVYKYIHDLNEYIEEVQRGVYIQHTLETLFQSVEGKQLLCESVYLFGTILLIIDCNIEGIIRERLLVAYHRYNAQEYNNQYPIEDICKLLRSTFKNKAKSYPEKYFERVPLNQDLINMVIERLRTDDIYNQLSSYPNTEHRSIALAGQAAMLFVCLFFKPEILKEKNAIMREIVDKFFHDNWIVNVYMGVTINIIDSWEDFAAARTALNNTIDTAEISSLASSRAVAFEKVLSELHKLLGNPNFEKKILDNINYVMNLCRSSNVLLRWYLLHVSAVHPRKLKSSANTKESEMIHEQVHRQSLFNDKHIFDLLITTSEFEFKIKNTFKNLLDEKEARWNKRKLDCVERMNELSEIFSGLTIKSRVEKNTNLQIWFDNIGKQIETISTDNELITSRKITKIISSLDEVQGYHRLAQNYQVTQTIKDTHAYLREMMKTIHVKDTVLIDLQIVGDFSYAWYHIDSFTGIMRDTIKKEPSFVIKLRSTFLKLVSCMEVPLIRINQCGSDKLMSVSQYYSNELIEYIRKVLHIIPETMFQYMDTIASLQANVIKEIPTRLDKDKLNDYAQLDESLEVANLTNSVSLLMEGVLCMEITLVGVVKVDPKQLLEDGIRKELVQHTAIALHKGLIFNPKAKTSELLSKLVTLGNIMTGYRRSFQYIQDFIDMPGLKIWLEELSRIIGHNVEIECNSFMSTRLLDLQSNNQITGVPVPLFEPCDNESKTFIGRLARELIRITSPKVAVYKEQTTAWYDYKTNEEIINIQFYSNIMKSIGVCGLTGLDKLIGFMILAEQKKLFEYIKFKVIKTKECFQILETIEKELSSLDFNKSHPIKAHQKLCSKLQKTLPKLLESIMTIGQLQIIRKQIFFELEVSSKLNARNLHDCIDAFNKSVMNEVRTHLKDPENTPYPGDENLLLPELVKMMDWTGIGDPYSKLFIIGDNLQYISLIVFLFTINQFSKLQYTEDLALLTWKKVGEPVDGAPLYIGVQSFLKQFHPDIITKYLVYLAEYMKSIISHSTKSIEKLEIPNEYYVAKFYVERFMFVANIDQQIFLDMVPHFLTDPLEHVKNISVK